MARPSIFMNKSGWLRMSIPALAKYKRDIFDHYRSTGFPFYSTDSEYRSKDFLKMSNYDFNRVMDGDTVKQSMHGLGLAWSYMPHSFRVQCGKLHTPWDVFHDDDKFKKVIEKRLQLGDYMADSGIRKMLRTYTGTQGVSNFRPTAAAAIYRKFLPRGGLAWDMSGGYGGRLLGSILAGVGYIATEPCADTYKGLVDINKDFGSGGHTEFLKLGSECVDMQRNALDLCFTSPPYFNHEKYSDEKTQSYLKYPRYDDWLAGFITDTFYMCHKGLKRGKFMLINIRNVKGYVNVESDIIKIAKHIGFKRAGTMKLGLSNLGGAGLKYEPVYIFRK